MAKEGVQGLYRGMSAGLFRQATYTTARMGLFNEFQSRLKATVPKGTYQPTLFAILKTVIGNLEARPKIKCLGYLYEQVPRG